LSRDSDGGNRINCSRNVNLFQSCRQSFPLVIGEDHGLGMCGSGESHEDKKDAQELGTSKFLQNSPSGLLALFARWAMLKGHIALRGEPIRLLPVAAAITRAIRWHQRFYFVNIGLEGVGGVGAACERLNVNQRFQPAGRFSLANSP
jgi:hypothetical protein